MDVLDRAALAVPGPEEHPDYVARMIGLRLLSVARLAGVLVAIIAGAVGSPSGVEFWIVAGLLLAAQLVVIAIAFSPRWERLPQMPFGPLGPLAFTVLVATSGGAHSPAAMTMVVFPAIGAFMLSRGRILATSGLLLLGLSAASLPDVFEGEHLALELYVTNVLALALAATVGVAITTGRGVLRDRIANLYLLRRLLLVDVLSAADTERRRISADLGAGPLQLLLAATQDLREITSGEADPGARSRCATTLREAAGLLRGTIVELREPRTAPPSTPAEDAAATDARTAARLLAVVRVAAAPPIVIAALLHVDDGGNPPALFAVLGLMAAVQAVALGWTFSKDWARVPVLRLAYADMVGLGVLVALSGNAASPVLAPAAILPLTFLLIGPFAVQVRVVAVLVTALLAATLPGIADGDPGTRLVVCLLTLTWTTGTAFLASVGRTRLEQRTAALETARRKLLQDSVAAQDAERAAVARALHDDALQLVLAAVQELDTDEPEAVSLALSHTLQATHSLREGADVLHPSALEHGGLAPALRDTAARAGRRGGPHPVVRVDEDVEPRHHELVIGLARELLTNVAKHAAARTVTVDVRADGAAVVLVVTDDGRGMEAQRPERALAQGHVGLASCRERVEAAGGTMHLESAPGHGATVRIRLP